MNPFSIYKACDWLDTDLLNYDNNTKTFGSATTLRFRRWLKCWILIYNG